MKIIYNILTAIFIPILSFGQFVEHFSDGDFTNSPKWSGTVTDFIINSSEELQLQASPTTSNAVSFLSTSVSIADSTTWEFLIKMNFAPSGENFARIYLSTDQADLQAPLNGYFIKLGKSGSDDAIELYRQDGHDISLLLTGAPATVANQPVLARIQIKRNNFYEWTIAADYTGGNSFTEEGSIVDSTYSHGHFFGWSCHYSASRSDRFFLDDIIIEPLFIDNIPPKLLTVSPISNNSLNIIFDEEINAITAENINNYQLSNNSINTAQISPFSSNTIQLDLGTPLTDGVTYTLAISNISDLLGNTITSTSIDFTYFLIKKATAYDVLVNEIMADPIPPVGLPIEEFIELYNRSDKNLNLENFEIIVGRTPRLLPAFNLPADTYVILCDVEHIDLFAPYGKVIGIEDLPSLNNSGTSISLISDEGELLHHIDYETAWYQNSNKDEGGWSLELKNPAAPCITGITNWQAANSGNGGTPGSINSALNFQLDESPLDLVRAFPISNNQLKLLFNKNVALTRAEDITNYSLNNFTIIDAFVSDNQLNTVLLTFAENFESNEVYEIITKITLTDCIGNPVGMFNTARFAIPAIIEAGDLVINELLYHPQAKGKDFLELYNNSNKILNISDLLIANRDEEEKLNAVHPVTTSYLLFPEEYVILTEDILDLQNRYPNGCNVFKNNFIKNDLPSFPTKTGSVVIYKTDTNTETIIDEFTYSDDLHHPLLDKTQGVSLERIDPNAVTEVASTWQSAASTVGFATPGCQNSHFASNEIDLIGENIFSIPNTVFSPDDDAFEDFLLINYQTERADFVANMKVYDINGRLIKHLLNNELLAQEGTIKWDGSTDNNTKARLGIYIISAEVFTPEGTRQQFKKTCVVAGKLE